MKQKNREILQRAAGIVDGLSWIANERIPEALVSVMEMLDEVLRDEEEKV